MAILHEKLNEHCGVKFKTGPLVGFLLVGSLWCVPANVEQLKEEIIIALATLKLQNTAN